MIKNNTVDIAVLKSKYGKHKYTFRWFVKVKLQTFFMSFTRYKPIKHQNNTPFYSLWLLFAILLVKWLDTGKATYLFSSKLLACQESHNWIFIFSSELRKNLASHLQKQQMEKGLPIKGICNFCWRFNRYHGFPDVL